jgi:hypothetical protein
MSDPVTPVRLAYLTGSGFKDENEAATALLAWVDGVGKDLLNVPSLSEQQRRGVTVALNDIPQAVGCFTRIIAAFPQFTREQKSNLVFMLIKLVDEAIELSAIAMKAGDDSIAARVQAGSMKGGAARAAKMKEQQKEWNDRAIVEARDILNKNATLTLEQLEARLRERWSKNPDWPALPYTTRLVKEFLSECRKDGRLPLRKTTERG